MIFQGGLCVKASPLFAGTGYHIRLSSVNPIVRWGANILVAFQETGKIFFKKALWKPGLICEDKSKWRRGEDPRAETREAMAMKQPGPQYLKTMVETASPVRNIIALYEKCLSHLVTARESLASGDIALKVESLRKAMDILFYLDSALDATEPEAAQPLHDSYQMILAQLSLTNSENSSEALDQAEKWLAGLLEAWQGVAPAGGNQGRAEPNP